LHKKIQVGLKKAEINKARFICHADELKKLMGVTEWILQLR